jgi:2-polyprenyl-3-methyl-5-hydroxy-6-metoxy-1,4-benzoquinol methylase
MHLSSIDKMKQFVDRYLVDKKNQPLQIFDLGATDIGGCYRPLFDQAQWHYQGADLVPGNNIDIVLSDPYSWIEIESNSVDVLISGQTFEHIQFFWKTMSEITRILKPNGLCCIIAPSGGPEHKYPIDCWRFFPDGFTALAQYSGLEVIETTIQSKDLGYSDGSDIWKDAVLVARKPVQKLLQLNDNHIYKRKIDTDTEDSLTKIIKLIQPETNILELGPATGYLTEYLKTKLNCRVDCVEKSEEMAKQAQLFCNQMIIKDIDHLDWESHFQDKTYDYIIMADVLEHLKEDERTLKACRKLLKSNGALILSIPNIAHAVIIGGLFKGRFDYNDEGLLDKTHLRFYTEESIEKLIIQSGFSVQRIDPIYTLPEDTVINDSLTDLPFEIQKEIYNLKNSLVYQFIIVCTPETEFLVRQSRNNQLTPSTTDMRKAYIRSLHERIASLERDHQQLLSEQKERHQKDVDHLKNKLKESKQEISHLAEQVNTLKNNLLFRVYRKIRKLIQFIKDIVKK